MRFAGSFIHISIALMAATSAFAASDENDNGQPAKPVSVGSPIWPPARSVLESTVARQDQFFTNRPSMIAIPTWIFPLQVSSTPQNLVPRSRTHIQSQAHTGKGSTQSPALFAKLATTSESGSLELVHGEGLFQGSLFLSGGAGVERTYIKKSGSIENFSSTVTNQSDFPSASLSLSGRVMPGLWLGVFREWRRSFQKTTNEVTVSGRTGANATNYRMDMARVVAGIEYQAKTIHLGVELEEDLDERAPSRSYSLPMRISVWPSFWLGLAGKRIYADDNINDEQATITNYEISIGRQMERFGIEIGRSTESGRLHSEFGQGSSSAQLLFVRAGWGEKVGLRILSRLAFKKFTSENSTHIVDKGQSWLLDLGMFWVR